MEEMIRLTLALFFSWALLLPAQMPDPSTTEAASRLAARISSLLPRRAMSSFEFQNLTALPQAEWSNFQSRLLDELRRLGVAAATTTQPDSRVRVTNSEDGRGRLLVAEVFTGDTRQIAMLPWISPPAAQTKPRLTINKKNLWAQPDPILDILLAESDSQMLVLAGNQVASYRWMDGKWTLSGTATLAIPHPMPRDPRGRLETSEDGFRAYLPSSTCEGTWKPELKVTCAAGTTTWRSVPVHWVADRNVLVSDAMKTPFYTTAAGMFAPNTGAEAWVSDIAAVSDPCGAGTAVIASSPDTEHDAIRAYQVSNGQATPASDAAPLAGPVTALWSSESAGQATLVVHNLQTGEYEASRLALACSQ
jgi:hypothetical protein